VHVYTIFESVHLSFLEIKKPTKDSLCWKKRWINLYFENK